MVVVSFDATGVLVLRMGFFGTVQAGDTTALASIGVDRTLTRLVALVRVASGGVAVVVATTAAGSTDRPGWGIAASLIVLVWSVLFAWRIVRHGPSDLLMAIDVLVVVVVLLAHGWLVPDAVRAVSAGTGWVDIVAGAGVLVAQFGLRQPLGVVVGVFIAAAYITGDGQMREAPVHLVVEALLAAGIVMVMRRAAANADTLLAAAAEQRRTAVVRAAVRSDERDHQRHLHDTVLATLTMVHVGGIAGDSAALPERAAADLAVIERLRAHPASVRPGPPVVRLDLLLRSTAAQPAPIRGDAPLEVSVDVAPIELPAHVANAMARCVAEALTNVARHAETGEAHLAGQADGDGASVTVSDNGAGFDVAAVPTHRRGLRESIQGRMRSVGGSADVRSNTGAGTQVVLRWPHD